MNPLSCSAIVYTSIKRRVRFSRCLSFATVRGGAGISSPPQGFSRVLALTITLTFSIAMAQSLAKASPDAAAQPHQQHTALRTLGVAHEDSAYRYLAEKGADLFRAGRFAEAERYYRAALTNAENDGIHDRRLAMLVTNLAADLRQQQKYEESEVLFERAVEIEKKLSGKDEELMVYTAKQYAALLRETTRDASGEAIIASAHNNFAMIPVTRAGSIATSQDDTDDEPITDGKNSKKESTEFRKKPALKFAQDQDSSDAESNSHSIFNTRNSTAASASTEPALSVMAELKMLADIEHGYMSQSMRSSQILPSGFSYFNSGPLYSSPGFSGAYIGGSGGSGFNNSGGFGSGGGFGMGGAPYGSPNSGMHIHGFSHGGRSGSIGGGGHGH